MNQRTRIHEEFPLYNENELLFNQFEAGKKGSWISPIAFDMNKLEEEYDYDTDEEQLEMAKNMLMQENINCIRYICREGDPSLLIENLEYQTSIPKKK